MMNGLRRGQFGSGQTYTSIVSLVQARNCLKRSLQLGMRVISGGHRAHSILKNALSPVTISRNLCRFETTSYTC